MNDVLSGIERELVISYLCDCNVPFTLVPIQPAKRIFSFSTGQQGVKVLSEGIILFPDFRMLPQEIVGQQVSLRFYFKKLGLSFFSVVTSTRAGALALVVPREIVRLPDSGEREDNGFTCNIFLGEAFSGECVSCVLNGDYPLFTPKVWEFLPPQPSSHLAGRLKGICGAVPVDVPFAVAEKLVVTGKALLVSGGWIQPGMVLPFDGCITTRDVVAETEFFDGLAQLAAGFYFTGCPDDTTDRTSTTQVFFIEGIHSTESLLKILPLIPICRYLSVENDISSLPAVLGRVPPLELLYVSDSDIVLAVQDGAFPLQLETEYSVLLQVPLQSLRRSITVDCTVDAIFDGGDGRVCARCRLENLKTEDQRFLFESLNNSRYL